jgi:hypothetical protein
MARVITKPGGPRALGVKTVSAGPQYAVISTDKILLIDDDAAGEQVTVVLPAASISSARELNIKKIGSTASVVIDGNGSETIDGATTQTIGIQYDSMHITCNGTAWFIV